MSKLLDFTRAAMVACGMPRNMADPLVQAARDDVGSKEKPGNSGFENPVLEEEMVEVGWQKGWAWCALIAEKWAKEAYPDKHDEFDRLFSASAVTTFSNFKREGYKISDKPVLGALVIWQKHKDGKKTWQGHAGICSKVISDTEFYSIEGNGSVGGSREGTTVVEVRRKIAYRKDGLNVLGFIILG